MGDELVGTLSCSQGYLEWGSGQSKYWTGASGVQVVPREIFRPKAAKRRAEHLLKTSVSAAFSAKPPSHEDIT